MRDGIDDLDELFEWGTGCLWIFAVAIAVCAIAVWLAYRGVQNLAEVITEG